jgi:hypothetical protein
LGSASGIEADAGELIRMKTDNIKKISIDSLNRLCIYPEKEVFTLIWRSATEVNWDSEDSFLYSPEPREWSYFDWFKHIIGVVKDDYNCDLLITKDTLWINIPESLKQAILNG